MAGKTSVFSYPVSEFSIIFRVVGTCSTRVFSCAQIATIAKTARPLGPVLHPGCRNRLYGSSSRYVGKSRIPSPPPGSWRYAAARRPRPEWSRIAPRLSRPGRTPPDGRETAPYRRPARWRPIPGGQTVAVSYPSAPQPCATTATTR